MRHAPLPLLFALSLAGCDLGEREDADQELSGAAATCQSWLPLVLIGVDAQIEVSDSADCDYAPAIDPSGDELPMPELYASESGEHVAITGPDDQIFRWVLGSDQRAGFAGGVHLDLPAPHGGSFAASGRGEPTSWLETHGGELTDIAMQGEHGHLVWRTHDSDLTTDDAVATHLEDGLPQKATGLGPQSQIRWNHLAWDLFATGLSAAHWEGGALRTLSTSPAGGAFNVTLLSPGGKQLFSKWTGHNGAILSFNGDRFPTGGSGPITGEWSTATEVAGRVSTDGHLVLGDDGFAVSWSAVDDLSLLDNVTLDVSQGSEYSLKSVRADGTSSYLIASDHLTDAAVGPSGTLNIQVPDGFSASLVRNVTLDWPIAAELTLSGADCGSAGVSSQRHIVHSAITTDCPVTLSYTSLGAPDGSGGVFGSTHAVDAVTPTLRLAYDLLTAPVVLEAPPGHSQLALDVSDTVLQELVVSAPQGFQATFDTSDGGAIEVSRSPDTPPEATGAWALSFTESSFSSLDIVPGPGIALTLSLLPGAYDFSCGPATCPLDLPDGIEDVAGATPIHLGLLVEGAGAATVLVAAP